MREINPRRIPVLISCRDRVSSLRLLVAWLEAAGHERIYLVDNGSTYPPLLEYYDQQPHEVIRLGDNIGPRGFWDAGVMNTVARGEHYVLTDDDVVPSEECPRDAVDHLLQALYRFSNVTKVGLGLRIDDLPKSYRWRRNVIAWESRFWDQHRIVAPGFYDAAIDTTFAVYWPNSPVYTGGLRTGVPYVARHLTWYSDSRRPTAEDVYYREHARTDGYNFWNRSNLGWEYRLPRHVRRFASWAKRRRASLS